MKFEQKGVSLIELLIVVTAIGFLIFLVASIPNAISLTTRSRNFSLAQQIILKQIEDKRATKYENLANGETPITDTRLNQLPSSTGKIVIEDCDLEVCPNNENAKSVKAMVMWKEQGKDENLEVSTLIGEGGLNQ